MSTSQTLNGRLAHPIARSDIMDFSPTTLTPSTAATAYDEKTVKLGIISEVESSSSEITTPVDSEV